MFLSWKTQHVFRPVNSFIVDLPNCSLKWNLSIKLKFLKKALLDLNKYIFVDFLQVQNSRKSCSWNPDCYTLRRLTSHKTRHCTLLPYLLNCNNTMIKENSTHLQHSSVHCIMANNAHNFTTKISQQDTGYAAGYSTMQYIHVNKRAIK